MSNEWQPIETAPKDGSIIEVKDRGHGDCLAMWWRAAEIYAYGWRKVYPRGGIMIPLNPVEWRPWP